MTKTAITLLLLAVAGIYSDPRAQQSEQDPLLGNYRLGESAEIMLLWSERSESDHQSFQRVYDFINLNNPDPNVPDELIPGELQVEDGDAGIHGDRQMDVFAGDFNGDAADDIVALWEAPDRTVNMIVPAIDKQAFTWSNSNARTLDGVTLIETPNSTTKRWLRLACGLFDDDPEEEFVLAYWADDGAIAIRLYDTNGTLTPVEQAAISDVTLATEGFDMALRSARFAVATGDLDGDFTDEIILVAGQTIPPNSGGCDASSGCWKVMLYIYDYDAETAQITAIDFPESERTLLQKVTRNSQWVSRLGVVAGDFDGDTFEEVAVGIHRADNSSASIWYLQTIDFAPDLSVIESVTPADNIHQTNGSNGYPITLVAGDLDNNGDDELLYAARVLDIFDWDDGMTRRKISNGSLGTQPGSDSHRILALADLDAENSVAQGDSVWRPEIITVRNVEINSGINPDGEVIIRVLKHTPGEFNLELLAEFQGETSDNSSPRGLFLAAGDFGSNGIRVGKPQRFTFTDIVEPLVILNAPPTHFDVFDGTPFDVALCYGENDCNFVSAYETESERTIEMETEFHRDWSIGASASGGFKIPILKVGVETKLEVEYGEGFSRYSRNATTFRVSQAIDAIADDWIYAVIVDYDIWEYPLYMDSAIEGYISIVVPNSRERAWFDSKSFSAFTYIPSHEVGNILSYQEIAAPEENSALDVAVRWDQGDRITLNNNSSATWTLTRENETETTTTNSDFKSIGGSVDFNIPFKFIPDISINGDYSEENVSTYSSFVRDQKGLFVHFDAIDLSFGNTRYAVTPYSYWSKNGALVLDYAVKPELPPNPLDPATWWSQNYGTEPDPAFILPWRYDPEKGLGLSEESQRFRTREIIFEPTDGLQPGDIVTIKARIQNFSLLPTTGPAKVQFYVGDPDEGGQVITSTEGQAAIFTDDAVQARGNLVVEMDWRLPDNVARFSRIYALIDPDGAMAEIHENNNKGWTVLQVEGGVPTNVDDHLSPPMPTEFTLQQNYPNPFNPITTISYSLSEESRVSLKIYDLLGREIKVLINGMRLPGRYSLDVDATDLASGVYFYQLAADPVFPGGQRLVETKKMIVVK